MDCALRPSQIPDDRLNEWAARRTQVGERIRHLRLQHGLSREALALEAGLSRNMLIVIEWGRKSIAYERLWDIADVLGVDVGDLLI